MYENIEIEVVEAECGLCEDYAKKHSSGKTKIAILSCEGACSRGEVSRRAANLISHRLAPESTVRICLGGAFTKNSGQRNLVKNARKVIAVEGCFINCSSRMMKGVIPDLESIVVQADSLYDYNLPFGIDEVSEDVLIECSAAVAQTILKEYVSGDCSDDIKGSTTGGSDNIKTCWD